MLSKISSVLIAAIAILCLLVFLVALLYLNPYRNDAKKLVHDHAHTLQFGAYIEIYDLSTPARVERLFVIKPENVILYNLDGALFYYLESSSVFCPREFSLVRFSRDEIRSVNESGLYNTVCTNVNSLVVLEHFLTLKNNVSDERILLTVDEIHYSILDIINLLIYTGYVLVT
ncbi:odv-e28 [Mamestra brassicae multiple nucleopolyhedrovirus]|uniref:Odv-e28 n=1 Tax=Mamestra brassicae nuclear polyhedrosis virus TaxID=78219 RepID=I3XMA0_NPVMB|nr:odv-e28 [Mamestra brassicae multiple nucleopolyhedrovirus]WNA17464.1 odv-e28 [Alphabaculovirus mabrassicae]WRQ96656.1 pif-4 [Mamestra configurata nucleopolyhedrovirus B]AFL64933.1 odv-e28 [Mamestra brassicae multiple nucleopolyhedrovirus]AFP95803.1 pif4 [Mamestra brassicae multiple nucleopolyhedrovirus]AIL25162.1 pif4 [Mamestra brassicae multiple nucleopolyhedrovirus]